MIEGIGTDIIEILRIEQVIERHGERFLGRIFTPKELAYCSSYDEHAAIARYAGHFAAKEAIAKALGTGIGKDLNWHNIEIGHNEAGGPICQLTPEADTRFNRPNIKLSISHCRDYATAFAIREA